VLRTNLSTRPFYNERAVQLVLIVAALLVVVLTAFNAIRIISLSRQNTEFSSLITRDRQEAERLTREAARIRAGIDQRALQATAESAEAANTLIDQRTFSWTEFFNRIEETLPADVMLTGVQPTFTKDTTTIQMTILARRTEDVDVFMEKLEGTGAFDDVLPVNEAPSEDGLHRLVLRAVYRPAAAPAAVSGGAPTNPAQAEPTPRRGDPAASPSDSPDTPAPAGPARGGRGR
jgi:hypothetical protein